MVRILFLCFTPVSPPLSFSLCRPTSGFKPKTRQRQRLKSSPDWFQCFGRYTSICHWWRPPGTKEIINSHWRGPSRGPGTHATTKGPRDRGNNNIPGDWAVTMTEHEKFYADRPSSLVQISRADDSHMQWLAELAWHEGRANHTWHWYAIFIESGSSGASSFICPCIHSL